MGAYPPAEGLNLAPRPSGDGTAHRPAPVAGGRVRSPWILWLIALVCALPSLLAAAVYFAPAWLEHLPAAQPVVDWLTPDGRTNYGALVEPQRPLPALAAYAPDGQPIDLRALRGKWVMLAVASGPCDDACARRLYAMRQVCASTGKDQSRIERVLVSTTAAPLPAQVSAAYAGTVFARVEAQSLYGWLPTAPDADARLYLVDPLGNLMLSWPAEADPARVRKDLGRLLWASQIG